MPKQTSSVAVYIRSACFDPQTTVKTILEREKKLRVFAKSIDKKASIRVFTDFGKSGLSLDRSSLKKLQKEVSRKKISAVLVTERSQIARDIKLLIQVEKFFKKHHCPLIYLNEISKVSEVNCG